MSLITIIWSMSASACLTLAAINFLVWFKESARSWTNLLLFSDGDGDGGHFAFCELRMMRVEYTGRIRDYAEVGARVRVAIGCVPRLDLCGVYLKAGRPWLAWTVCGLRTLALFSISWWGRISTTAMITRLRHILFLRETVPDPRVYTTHGCWWVS